MNLLLLRILFVISSMVMGYSLMSVRAAGPMGILLGGLIALVLVFAEIGLRKISVTGLSSVVFGLMQREDDQRYKLVMTSLRNLRNRFNPSFGFSPSRVILNLLEEYIYKYPEQWYQWGKYSKIRVIPQDVVGFEKGNLLSQLEPGFRQVLTAGLG